MWAHLLGCLKESPAEIECRQLKDGFDADVQSAAVTKLLEGRRAHAGGRLLGDFVAERRSPARVLLGLISILHYP